VGLSVGGFGVAAWRGPVQSTMLLAECGPGAGLLPEAGLREDPLVCFPCGFTPSRNAAAERMRIHTSTGLVLSEGHLLWDPTVATSLGAGWLMRQRGTVTFMLLLMMPTMLVLMRMMTLC